MPHLSCYFFVLVITLLLILLPTPDNRRLEDHLPIFLPAKRLKLLFHFFLIDLLSHPFSTNLSNKIKVLLSNLIDFLQNVINCQLFRDIIVQVLFEVFGGGCLNVRLFQEERT